MSLFFIVCTLCLFAVPLVFGYFAGRALLAPLDWAIQTIRLSRRPPPRLLPSGDGPRLLTAGDTPTLTPETRPEVRRRIDESALAKRRIGARDFQTVVDGQPLWLRSQPSAVDERGHPVNLPLAGDQRREAQYVSSTWLLVDLSDTLPEQLHLHVQWMPDENVLGHEGLAAGLLDAELQPLLRTGDQLLITEGRIGIDSPFAAREHRVPRLVQALARAANRIAAATEDGHVDVAQLLVETAQQGGVARARARAVATMLERFKDHPSADEVRRRALTDDAPDVRFAAARHSGADGFDIVEAIVFDEDASDGLRQRALRFLIRERRDERSTAALERLVRDGPERLRQIAIRHVGKLEPAAALPALLEAAKSQDTQTLVDVAEALGALGAPEAEPVLLGLLAKPSLALQIAAAENLGALGTLVSVESLVTAAQRTGAARELRLAALSAVHAIRSRSTRTGVGALSLAEQSDVGGLSLPAPLEASEDDAA